MNEESIYQLDSEALKLFAQKGYEGGPHVLQAGQANAVKVRRIMQITRDLAGRSFPELRILDLGCGEGVYAIEAGLRGAEILALDARTQRMRQGIACADRHSLVNVKFIEEDVRHITIEKLGSFDVVYLLGLLYHLDAPDVFVVLKSVYSLCTRMLIIDTFISLIEEIQVEWENQVYKGRRVREHEDEDNKEVRKSKVLRSIDNTFSFRFTKESLLKVLHQIGFTSVYECHVPFEHGKPKDRITLVAIKDLPVLISTYPWLNHKSEAEIEQILQDDCQEVNSINDGRGDP